MHFQSMADPDQAFGWQSNWGGAKMSSLA